MLGEATTEAGVRAFDRSFNLRRGDKSVETAAFQPSIVKVLVAAASSFVLGGLDNLARLQKAGWRYYEFIGGTARLMTSWRTSEEDIAAFVASATGECKST